MKNSESRKALQTYFVITLNGMAYGLFATLIIGTIISQFALLLGIPTTEATHPLNLLANTLKGLMGAGIGIGVALALKEEGLRLITLGAAGAIATAFVRDPSVAYITVITTQLVFRFILKKKTPVDILLIPLLGSFAALLVSWSTGPTIQTAITWFGQLINEGTTYAPFWMGVIVAVLMGIALTAPISSAAIAISLNLTGLAAGAALAGCTTQMVGFAVMSRKDNKWPVVLSVGIGTSMLQFKNIIKKPLLWLPTILVSAITGPLATMVFMAQSNAIGAGMGTSGLVGPLQTLAVMNYSPQAWLVVTLLYVAIPVVLVWAIDLLFRHKNWIKSGDLTI